MRISNRSPRLQEFRKKYFNVSEKCLNGMKCKKSNSDMSGRHPPIPSNIRGTCESSSKNFKLWTPDTNHAEKEEPRKWRAEKMKGKMGKSFLRKAARRRSSNRLPLKSNKNIGIRKAKREKCFSIRFNDDIFMSFSFRLAEHGERFSALSHSPSFWHPQHRIN